MNHVFYFLQMQTLSNWKGWNFKKSPIQALSQEDQTKGQLMWLNLGYIRLSKEINTRKEDARNSFANNLMLSIISKGCKIVPTSTSVESWTFGRAARSSISIAWSCNTPLRDIRKHPFGCRSVVRVLIKAMADAGFSYEGCGLKQPIGSWEKSLKFYCKFWGWHWIFIWISNAKP